MRRVLTSWTAAAAATIAIQLAATDAEADEGLPVDLTWTREGPCQPTPSVETRLRALLADGPTDVPPVRARLAMDAVVGGVAVTLDTEQLGESGRRSFTARDCERAADAVALILSVMLEPVATTEAVAAGKATEAFGGPAPGPARRAEPPREAARPDREATLRVGFGPRLGFDVGVAPAPTLLAGGTVSLFGEAWRASLGAAWWVPRASDEGPREGTGATVEVVSGDARGCWTFLSEPMALDACGVLEAGRVRGTGLRLRNSLTADRR